MDIKNAEYYFIQFLFAKNWELLKKDNRKLYDAMYDRYKEIYYECINANVDVMSVNKRFLNIFGL